MASLKKAMMNKKFTDSPMAKERDVTTPEDKARVRKGVAKRKAQIAAAQRAKKGK